MIAGELEGLFDDGEDTYDQFLGLGLNRDEQGKRKLGLPILLKNPLSPLSAIERLRTIKVPPAIKKELEKRGLVKEATSQAELPKQQKIPRSVDQDASLEELAGPEPEGISKNIVDNPGTKQPDEPKGKSNLIYWIGGTVLVLGTIIGIAALVHLKKSNHHNQPPVQP